MKKILVAGNSHIGALKSGLGKYLEKQPSFCDHYELMFAGTTGAEDLTVNKGSLTVSPSSARRKEFLMTTDGQERLDLANFSHVFLVGKLTPLDARLFFNVNLQPVSSSIISGVVRQIIGITFSLNSVYSKMVEYSPGKCFWIPNPCEPEKLNSILSSGTRAVHRDFQKIRGTKYQSFYLPFLNSIQDHEVEVLRSLAENIKNISISIASEKGLEGIIFTPDYVLKNSFLTLSDYSVDSRHFVNNTVEPEVDPHMNSAYGEIIISSMNSLLNGCN